MLYNQKGFTLIESIISFAILALAGSMFIFGFMNVANIASEGSLIKTEVDELYYQLLDKSDPLPIIEEDDGDEGKEVIYPVPETQISIKFKDDSHTKVLDNIYIYQETKTIHNINISLSRIVPLKKLDYLPSDVPDEPVIIDTSIVTQFKILNSNNNMPIYDVNTNSWKGQSGFENNSNYYTLNNNYLFYENCITDKISNVDDGIISNNIDQYLANVPPDLITQSKNNCSYIGKRGSWFIDDVDLLSGKTLTVKWFGIKKETENGKIITTVYGFLVPTNGQYAIYNGKMDVVSSRGFGRGSINFLKITNGLNLPNGSLMVIDTSTNITKNASGSNLKSYWNTTRNEVFGTSSGLWYIN